MNLHKKFVELSRQVNSIDKISEDEETNRIFSTYFNDLKENHGNFYSYYSQIFNESKSIKFSYIEAKKIYKNSFDILVKIEKGLKEKSIELFDHVFDLPENEIKRQILELTFDSKLESINENIQKFECLNNFIKNKPINNIYEIEANKLFGTREVIIQESEMLKILVEIENLNGQIEVLENKRHQISNDIENFNEYSVVVSDELTLYESILDITEDEKEIEDVIIKLTDLNITKENVNKNYSQSIKEGEEIDIEYIAAKSKLLYLIEQINDLIEKQDSHLNEINIVSSDISDTFNYLSDLGIKIDPEFKNFYNSFQINFFKSESRKDKMSSLITQLSNHLSEINESLKDLNSFIKNLSNAFDRFKISYKSIEDIARLFKILYRFEINFSNEECLKVILKQNFGEDVYEKAKFEQKIDFILNLFSFEDLIIRFCTNEKDISDILDSIEMDENNNESEYVKFFKENQCDIELIIEQIKILINEAKIIFIKNSLINELKILNDRIQIKEFC